MKTLTPLLFLLCASWPGVQCQEVSLSELEQVFAQADCAYVEKSHALCTACNGDPRNVSPQNAQELNDIVSALNAAARHLRSHPGFGVSLYKDRVLVVLAE